VYILAYAMVHHAVLGIVLRETRTAGVAHDVAGRVELFGRIGRRVLPLMFAT
jgi:hypothetical protein